MSDGDATDDFHFLEKKDDETGNEFLKRRLTYLREYYSYEELSGLSVDELNRQYELFRITVQKTKRNFTNSDFIYSDKLDVYESIIGEEVELYEPLTEKQRMQIVNTINKINRNFDKAREDTRDRKYERLSKVMSSVPMLNRIQKKP